MILSLLLIELLLLYLLSRRLIQGIYTLVYLPTRSRSVGIWVVTIIFFPGTVVHELAHLFVAEVLRVRTGKLTLIPEGLEGKEGVEGEVKTGSVAIAQTDPFRRTLIGLAPVYVGIVVLAAISWWLPSLLDTVFTRPPLAVYPELGEGQGEALQNGLLLTLALYALFAVSNSMFASREDMKGVIPFTITLGLFVAAGYLAGLRIGLTGELLTRIILVIRTLVRSLGIVLVVNLAVLATTSLFLSLLSPRK